MYLVYCDDSRDGKKKQLMTAIIVKDSSFRVVEGYMGYIIESHVPEEKREDFEFHASELFNGQPPFENIDTATAIDIFVKCCTISTEEKIPIIYSCVDLQKLSSGNFGSASPLDVAFRLCLPEIERWFKENAPSELGVVICDDCTDKKLKDNLQNSFRLKRRKIKTSVEESEGKIVKLEEDRGELPHLHDAMYFGSSGHSKGIQLADIYGYIIKRHISQNAELEFLYKHLEPLMFARKHEPNEKQEESGIREIPNNGGSIGTGAALGDKDEVRSGETSEKAEES